MSLNKRGRQDNIEVAKRKPYVNCHKINERRFAKMLKYYANDPEGAEIDCPDCGSDAIVTDEGVVCSNEGCPGSSNS